MIIARNEKQIHIRVLSLFKKEGNETMSFNLKIDEQILKTDKVICRYISN